MNCVCVNFVCLVPNSLLLCFVFVFLHHSFDHSELRCELRVLEMVRITNHKPKEPNPNRVAYNLILLPCDLDNSNSAFCFSCFAEANRFCKLKFHRTNPPTLASKVRPPAILKDDIGIYKHYIHTIKKYKKQIRMCILNKRCILYQKCAKRNIGKKADFCKVCA